MKKIILLLILYSLVGFSIQTYADGLTKEEKVAIDKAMEEAKQEKVERDKIREEWKKKMNEKYKIKENQT